MTDANESLAIKFIDVSKIYKTYTTPQHRLVEILSGGKKRYAHETRALDDVSFSIKRGGRLGIIGENGSGKSTLLKVLAGVLTPSSGSVQVSGRISALLELGAGFNSELSGTENIRQYCMLHGMNKDEIEDSLPQIIRFSELEDSIYHPVKTYSSGMAMRLGFSCAVHVKPDILIVDEALSVGDTYFQNKCLYKIRSMLDGGATFIYVTHSSDAIRTLCDTGLWLEKGSIKMLGASNEVGAAYQSAMFDRLVRHGHHQEKENVKDIQHITDTRSLKSEKVDHAKRSVFASRVNQLRTGSGEILITDICLVNDNGVEVDSVGMADQLCIRVYFKVNSLPPDNAAVSVGITDSYGREIIHFNSALKGYFVSDLHIHEEAIIEFSFVSPLCPGEFGLMAGIGTLDKHPQINDLSMPTSIIDYCAGGARFSVNSPFVETGKYDLWGLIHIDYEANLISLS